MTAIEPRSLANAIGLTALVGFVMYRRIRRSVGRQRLKPRPLWVRMSILGVVCVLVLGAHLTDPQSWLAAAVGALAGSALGFFSLRHTVFENTPDGRFYTPHAMIGLGVSAVFIARIAYRFFVASPAMSGAAAHRPDVAASFAQAFSPLTLGIYFALAGYYIAYYAGVLARFRNFVPPQPTS